MYDELVRARALAGLDSGSTLSEMSRQLGVSRAAIRSWTTDPTSGAARPGCPAPAALSGSYSALLGYYLGDGCISQHRRTWAMRISCDRSNPGVIEDVLAQLRAIHPGRRTYLVAAPGVVVVQQYWKHWPCLFPQHGPGRKHERDLTLADWQEEIVAAYPADFLRGLFHSDGCLVQNWASRVVAGKKKRYAYPRWQFVNESSDIMRWCGEALDRAGVAWRQTTRRTLSVSRREAVARLTALIGEKS